MPHTLRKLSAFQLHEYCAASRNPPRRALAKAYAVERDEQLARWTAHLPVGAALLAVLDAAGSGADAVAAAEFVLRMYPRDDDAVANALFAAATSPVSRRLAGDLATPPTNLPDSARTAWAFFAVTAMLRGGCSAAAVAAAMAAPGAVQAHVLHRLKRWRDNLRVPGCCFAFAAAAACEGVAPEDAAFVHLLEHGGDGDDWDRLAARRPDNVCRAVASSHARQLANSSFPACLPEDAMCTILARGGEDAARAALLRAAHPDSWLALMNATRDWRLAPVEFLRCTCLDDAWSVVNRRNAAHDAAIKRMFDSAAAARAPRGRGPFLSYAYLFYKMSSLLQGAAGKEEPS